VTQGLDGQAPPVDSKTIGEGIRRIRQRRGMTLAHVAAETNLTISAISQIERGVSDPSIGSLRRIARAFGVPVFQFLLETDRRDIVVRRDERRRIRFTEGEPDYFLVSADMSGEFEVISSIMQPGEADPALAPKSHPSEECTLVLRGRIQAEVAGHVYELAEGDSIKIHRELLHRFVNVGEVEAEILMVISPPTF
jgi:transcriptional regulator with XRE-family HTH domain